jgi:hypothetical protein
MRLAPIAAVAALPLFLTACASLSSPAQQAGSSASASPKSPDAGLLTGNQLKSKLEPSSWFPAGFSFDTQGAVDSGLAYQQPSTSAAAPHCQNLNATAWIGLAGIGSVSFAENDYLDQSTSEQYAQEIDVFQGTGAETAMANLRKLARTCPSFKDSQTSSSFTVTLRPGPKLGDDSLGFRLSSPRWQGDTALAAVRVGTAIVTVLYSADSGTGAAQATRLATAVAGNLERKS